MRKLYYGIIYFLICIEPLTGGHIKMFISLPFAMAFLVFLSQTKKEEQGIHYVLIVLILSLGGGMFLWKSVIFLTLFYLTDILERKLPLEYMLKDFVMVFVVNLVFMILINLKHVAPLDFISLKCVATIGIQTIYSLIYLLILKKSEGLMIDKYEKTNGYR
jgi:Na+/alanine symporter